MRFAKTLALIAGAVLAAGTALPAQAAGPARVDLRGVPMGSFVVDATGTAHLSGNVTGKPFDGTYTAVLTADDGSLPDRGVCEPATATVDVTGERGRYLQLVGTGRVCGEYSGPTWAVDHRFVGRYQVVSSSVRSARGTDGWYSLILATEGRANLEAIDT